MTLIILRVPRDKITGPRCGRYTRIILLSRTSLRAIFARTVSLHFAGMNYLYCFSRSLLAHRAPTARTVHVTIRVQRYHRVLRLTVISFLSSAVRIPSFSLRISVPGLRIPVPWLSKPFSRRFFSVLCSLFERLGVSRTRSFLLRAFGIEL